MNKIGPSTEPCGTPKDTVTDFEDGRDFSDTLYVRLLKYDLNHCNAKPETPNLFRGGEKEYHDRLYQKQPKDLIVSRQHPFYNLMQP